MVGPRVVCADCQSVTHEAADCPQRKQREVDIANRAKHLQGNADKLARLGLPAAPVTSPSNESAAYDAVNDIMWMSTTEQMQQMQLPSSSLRPATLSSDELCLANAVEQYRRELQRQC